MVWQPLSQQPSLKKTCMQSYIGYLLHFFPENTHEQQLISAKILYQCPSRNILDFIYGGSQFSTGVIFLCVRHVINGPLWHFFYTWDIFFYGQGVISLRRKMTPRSFFDGGRYSSLHRHGTMLGKFQARWQARIWGRRLTLSHITCAVTCTDIGATRLLRTKQAPPFGTREEGVPLATK